MHTHWLLLYINIKFCYSTGITVLWFLSCVHAIYSRIYHNMNRLLITILLSIIWQTMYAGEEDRYPDTIVPAPFTFRYFSEDSIKLLKDYLIASMGGDGIGERSGYEEVSLFSIGDKIHLAIKHNGEWSISVESLGVVAMDNRYSVSPLNLDDDSLLYEILIEQYHSDGRGNPYGGFDYHGSMYWLVNVEKEYSLFLKETYYNETIEYSGYRAGNEGTEEELDRENEELEKSENFSSYIEADDCTIRVLPGKVIFDAIQCTYCVPALDSVFAVEYILRNDTLIKGNIHPQFRNLAEPFGYKVLRGAVGKYPVTMHLTQIGEYFTGFYYYDKYNTAIGLEDNSSFDSSGAQLVLGEMKGDGKCFRGAIKGNTFSGEWTDGKKTLDFQLKEDYSNGSTPLKAYYYKDSILLEHNNRYDVSALYYVADTADMSYDDAQAVNRRVYSYYSSLVDIITESPMAVFTYTRWSAFDDLYYDIFKQTEDANYYTNVEKTITYNQNGMLSFSSDTDEFTGGMRIGHSWRVQLIDVKRKKTMSARDIFSCSDSVLRNVIEEVYLEQYKDTLSKQLQEYDRFYFGEMGMEPGNFTFFFNAYPHFVETISIPFKRLEAYMRPEYKERLLGK